ncbi:MAG TPA: VRR-NUC domain-containing protein [Gaiellales bacterium]|jgi:hypothetical protein|nr:VRR-NUC domain-containing protein [Gaiellales bacterium]
MTAPAVHEKGVQASVVHLARLLGWAVFYVRDSRGSPAGWPDLVLIRDDRLLFRELKTDRGRLSPDQQRCRERLEKTGADVGVWRPADWWTIEATLKGQLDLEDGGF